MFFAWDGLVRGFLVFGDPVREGNVTLIPVAGVGYGFGYGGGRGRMAAGQPGVQEGTGEPGEGSGSGGGGAGMARPLGYIRVTADEVKYEPIMDTQRMGLFGIAMVMWNVFWIAAAVRAFARR